MKKRLMVILLCVVLCVTMTSPCFALDDDEANIAEGAVTLFMTGKSEPEYDALRNAIQKGTSISDTEFDMGYLAVTSVISATLAENDFEYSTLKDYYVYDAVNDDIRDTGCLYFIVVPDEEGTCAVLQVALVLDTLCASFDILNDEDKFSVDLTKLMVESVLSSYEYHQTVIPASTVFSLYVSDELLALVNTLAE